MHLHWYRDAHVIVRSRIQPAAPAPFTISTTYNDPTLTNGPMGWALAIGGNSNEVFIYGGGHYDFFNVS